MNIHLINMYFTRFNKLVNFQINKVSKKIKFNKKNSIIISIVSIFFLFFVYLSIPSLYNFNNLKSKLEKKIKNEFNINIILENDIKYVIFPTPRLKLKNIKILNFNEKEDQNISIINSVIIPIKILSLIGVENLKFSSININNSSFEFFDTNITNIKFLFSKVLSTKKIKIKNSQLIIKDKKNNETILNTEIKNLIIYSRNNVNKVVGNNKLYGTNLNFTYNESFNPNIKSTFQFHVPKLGLKTKTIFLNKKNEKLKASSIIRYPKNKIEIFYDNNGELFKINKSKMELNFLDSNFLGSINLNPFNFEIDFEVNDVNLTKIFSHRIVKSINNFLPINKKINGNLNFDIKNFIVKSKILESGKINLEFRNGILDIVNANFFLKNIGNIRINGPILKQNKKNYFIFNSQLDIKNKDLLYSKLLVPKSKRSEKINMIINGTFNFDNNELIFKEVLNNQNQLDEKILLNLNSEIDKFISKNPLESIFSIFKFRLFINNLLETN